MLEVIFSHLMYFSGPKFGKIKYISFFSLTLKNLMYFSGLKKWKILSFRTRIFMFSDPLKYTSFFSLTLQNLVYFSGPKFGKIKYISFFSLTLKNLMYFSGLKKWKFLSFRTRIFMFSDPLKYTSFFFSLCKTLCTLVDPNLEK